MEYEVNIEEDTTIIEKFPSISRGLYIHDFQVTIDYITKYSNTYVNYLFIIILGQQNNDIRG